MEFEDQQLDEVQAEGFIPLSVYFDFFKYSWGTYAVIAFIIFIFVLM
jgi:hypothetical protein